MYVYPTYYVGCMYLHDVWFTAVPCASNIRVYPGEIHVIWVYRMAVMMEGSHYDIPESELKFC